MKREYVPIIILITLVIWFVFIGYLIINDKSMRDNENTIRESICIQAGFDHYYPNNGITTVQGQTYISCEREQIQDGILNRTERWIPYNETKP